MLDPKVNALKRFGQILIKTMWRSALRRFLVICYVYMIALSIANAQDAEKIRTESEQRRLLVKKMLGDLNDAKTENEKAKIWENFQKESESHSKSTREVEVAALPEELRQFVVSIDLDLDMISNLEATLQKNEGVTNADTGWIDNACKDLGNLVERRKIRLKDRVNSAKHKLSDRQISDYKNEIDDISTTQETATEQKNVEALQACLRKLKSSLLEERQDIIFASHLEDW